MIPSSNTENQNAGTKKIDNSVVRVALKVLVIGDYAVGKTAIVKQYVEGRFSSNYKITIGADFLLKTVVWDNNTQLNIQLWDIAGHERITSMTRVYYRYATAAAVVFDVSRTSTFLSVQKWLNDLRNKITLPNGSPIPVIIMANKCDISGTAVPKDALDKLCREWGVKAWYLTSAKNNYNIDKAMAFLVSCAMENKMKEVTVEKNTVILTSKVDGDTESKFCCL